jgi:hypothetical protein
LPYLKAEGKLVMITPQEWAYRLDPTHVRFVGFDALRRHADATELRILRQFSFPFPRTIGRLSPYNEFIVIALKKGRNTRVSSSDLQEDSPVAVRRWFAV